MAKALASFVVGGVIAPQEAAKILGVILRRILRRFSTLL